jgi:RNA polymerase sigma factor (sigma-70 family)
LALEDNNALVEDLAASHGERLRRFLRSRVRNTADIPDIVQEVFLRLLRVPNRETIRVPEAYIFTIARHVAQQHTLQSSAGRISVERGEVLSELSAVSDADPALEVGAEQCLNELEIALRQLPLKIQTSFLLHRRDGLSIDEVSAKLGISRPMAKKYLVKALVHLRKRLRDTA